MEFHKLLFAMIQVVQLRFHKHEETFTISGPNCFLHFRCQEYSSQAGLANEVDEICYISFLSAYCTCAMHSVF